MTAAVPRLRRRRSRRAQILERKWTYGIGAVAIGTTVAVTVYELAHVWRRGGVPLPHETDDVLGAAGQAARQSMVVAFEGYRSVSERENALLNMLVTFSVTLGVARLSTHRIRAKGSFGPFRDLHVGGSHIHHFVPGIAVAFLAGGASIAARDPSLDKWCAIPFGAGVALTLDEAALLLRLEDVYWTEEGVLSVQVALSAMALLSILVLVLRVLRRGEDVVLDGEPPEPGSIAAELARAREVHARRGLAGEGI